MSTDGVCRDTFTDADGMRSLVQALVRKSVHDALARNGGDGGKLAEELQAELDVLGRLAGQADNAFRAMVLDEIAAALAERSRERSSPSAASCRGDET